MNELEILETKIEDITKRLEIKKYIAVINKDFGVIFPDFDGCVSVGKDLNDAINMAQEALEFHVSFIREYGEELPEPTTLEQVKKEYPDNVFKYQPIFIK
jgi:predicted RNase H-like HicB family nuclease